MIKDIYTKKAFLFFSILIIVVLTRLIPHPVNFSPLGALALFSGFFLINHRFGFLLPVGALLMSDVIMELINPGYGFYSVMPFVYGSVFLIMFIGRLIKNNLNVFKLLGFSISSSILFFILTNFGVWYSGNFYPANFSGLMLCYEAAIPFFRNTLISDLVFNTIFFGAYFLALSKYAHKLSWLKA